jgi:scyllo-inositol 2-dehydrogenase (NADP+)
MGLTIAVGLVGFGLSARVLHTPLILASGMRIDAVVTRQAALVRSALPEARVLPDLESLLAIPEIPLIVIATPNHLHFPQALAALERGRHVVVDKPLALSSLEADRLIEAAGQHRRVLAVFHNRRWDSDFLTLRRLIDEQALGALTAFEARWDRYRPAISERWREHGEYGGGVLYDLGSHLIDQTLCLFGMPEWIQAQLLHQRPGARVDDGFEIAMRVGSLRLALGSSSIAADHALRYRLHGFKGSFRKSGLDVQEQQLRAGLAPEDAAFGLEPSAQWGTLIDGEAREQPVPAERGRWLEFYAAMRRCLDEGAPPPVGASEARRVLHLIEAAQRSAELGCRIELD